MYISDGSCHKIRTIDLAGDAPIPVARSTWGRLKSIYRQAALSAGGVRVDPHEIRPGDVIWFPPGEKHWHGAAPATAMTHTAVQERLDGKTLPWMEKVSDEQYGAQ